MADAQVISSVDATTIPATNAAQDKNSAKLFVNQKDEQKVWLTIRLYKIGVKTLNARVMMLRLRTMTLLSSNVIAIATYKPDRITVNKTEISSYVSQKTCAETKALVMFCWKNVTAMLEKRFSKTYPDIKKYTNQVVVKRYSRASIQ